jgi:excisionase family DNA binding protein
MAREREAIKPGAVYTLQEACAILQISAATALRWINDGKLNPSRIGRGYRFTGRQILDALNPPEEPAPPPEPTSRRRGAAR